jgi:hypothetical protein
MPLKKKKARQAKAQRVQGEKFFKKSFIDNLDNRNDPDWVNEEDSDSDSEFDGRWAVSISEVVVPDLEVSNAEDEEEAVVERRNGEGGIKRKVAIDKDESDKDEQGTKEAEAHQILSGVEAFWKEKFSKVSLRGILNNYLRICSS